MRRKNKQNEQRTRDPQKLKINSYEKVNSTTKKEKEAKENATKQKLPLHNETQSIRDEE